jgi:hypothetical protein
VLGAETALVGLERFLHETRLRTPAHPNILPLIDSGAAGGLLPQTPYVPAELRERPRRERQSPVERHLNRVK